MAQPSSKIAEAFCGGEKGHEGDAKLRGDSGCLLHRQVAVGLPQLQKAA